MLIGRHDPKVLESFAPASAKQLEALFPTVVPRMWSDARAVWTRVPYDRFTTGLHAFVKFYIECWRDNMSYHVVTTWHEQNADNLDIFVAYNYERTSSTAAAIERFAVRLGQSSGTSQTLVGSMTLWSSDNKTFVPQNSWWRHYSLLFWIFDHFRLADVLSEQLQPIATNEEQLAGYFSRHNDLWRVISLSLESADVPELFTLAEKLRVFGGKLCLHNRHAAVLDSNLVRPDQIPAFEWGTDAAEANLSFLRCMVLWFGHEKPTVSPEQILQKLTDLEFPSGARLRNIDPELGTLLSPRSRPALIQWLAPVPASKMDEVIAAAFRRLDTRDRSIRAEEGRAVAYIRGRDDGVDWQVRVEAAWPATSRLRATPIVVAGGGYFYSYALIQAIVKECEATQMRGDEARSHAAPYVLAPGEPLDEAVSGPLLDYSACATANQAKEWSSGVLPVGVWAFSKGDRAVYGPPIYLDRDSLPKGTLVCAPTGVGKTHLLAKWALAARDHGYSVFIIDVKGNLLEEHPQLDRGDGRLFHFSTDSEVPSDRINFLGDLTWIPPRRRPGEDYEETKQYEFAQIDSRAEDIAKCLLEEPKTQDDERRFYKNRLNWLHSFIHLLKLQEFYFPDDFKQSGQMRRADLADLYDLVRDENKLIDIAMKLLAKERDRIKDPRCPPASFGAEHWLRSLGPLIRRDVVEPLRPFAQQAQQDNFGLLTINLADALKPFSIQLRRRVRDFGSGRLLRIEDVFSRADPQTVVFSVPGQSSSTKALLSIAVKRLHQLVEARMKAKNRKVPLLLLLDETKMIHGFDPIDYVALNRQANAGCVLVYQDLGRIGNDDRQTLSLLSNVGAQIYMGSFTGETLRIFQRALGKRRRVRFDSGTSRSVEGASKSERRFEEEVDYLGSAELRNLPAGSRPGLVVMRTNQGNMLPPVLVDLDEEAVPAQADSES